MAASLGATLSRRHERSSAPAPHQLELSPQQQSHPRERQSALAKTNGACDNAAVSACGKGQAAATRPASAQALLEETHVQGYQAGENTSTAAISLATGRVGTVVGEAARDIQRLALHRPNMLQVKAAADR